MYIQFIFLLFFLSLSGFFRVVLSLAFSLYLDATGRVFNTFSVSSSIKKFKCARFCRALATAHDRIYAQHNQLSDMPDFDVFFLFNPFHNSN